MVSYKSMEAERRHVNVVEFLDDTTGCLVLDRGRLNTINEIIPISNKIIKSNAR